MAKILNNNYLSIEQMQNQYLNNNASESKSVTADGLSFDDILKKNLVSESSELKFSKHASDRLNDRSIELSDSQMERLENASQMAESKGIKNSLIMVDSLAFIVNVPNNTVVTAMDETETNSHVFTNIDGAVFG
ncbi:MAG: flagellar protein [Eubacterium sp.]|nr:flagellar protein [Eubacterium sp.]